MLMNFLSVALGGAIGASLRFGAGLVMTRLVVSGFPFATLAVNIIGSFFMGVVVVYAFQRGFEQYNLFVMTGILGGFTTFSAFSLEAFSLFERGQPGAAALYVIVSVIGAIVALVSGVYLARMVWA